MGMQVQPFTRPNFKIHTTPAASKKRLWWEREIHVVFPSYLHLFVGPFYSPLRLSDFRNTIGVGEKTVFLSDNAHLDFRR